MQKIINGIAILSGVVSLTVVGSGVVIYLQKDAIIENIKEKALGSLTDGIGDALPGNKNNISPLPRSFSAPI